MAFFSAASLLRMLPERPARILDVPAMSEIGITGLDETHRDRNALIEALLRKAALAHQEFERLRATRFPTELALEAAERKLTEARIEYSSATGRLARAWDDLELHERTFLHSIRTLFGRADERRDALVAEAERRRQEQSRTIEIFDVALEARDMAATVHGLEHYDETASTRKDIERLLDAHRTLTLAAEWAADLPADSASTIGAAVAFVQGRSTRAQARRNAPRPTRDGQPGATSSRTTDGEGFDSTLATVAASMTVVAMASSIESSSSGTDCSSPSTDSTSSSPMAFE